MLPSLCVKVVGIRSEVCVREHLCAWVWKCFGGCAGLDVIFRLLWPMGYLTRCHTHTHKHLHTQTCMISLHPLGNVCWIKTKVNKSSLCAHTRSTQTQTRPRRHTVHISCLLFPYLYSVSDFAAPAVKFPRSYWATENRGFTLLTVFGIQRHSRGGDVFLTKAA